MSDFKSITPLSGSEPQVISHGPVTVTERCDFAMASFASRLGAETQAKSALEGFLEAQAPAPLQAIFGTRSAFWTGRDQWMVLASLSDDEDLADQLTQAAQGHASVTDQSDGWCCFELTGEGLGAVFERLCPVDFAAWTGGQATRTSIDHLGCFLVCEKAQKIAVFGPRSSAQSLHHALITALKSAH